jgi:hypothetical protein
MSVIWVEPRKFKLESKPVHIQVLSAQITIDLKENRILIYRQNIFELEKKFFTNIYIV